jgi:ribose 5-phosphate isomerase A
MSGDRLKRAAAEAALNLVKPDMTIGLGTGSTAAHFIALLGARVRDGLPIAAIATSADTARKAMAEGIDVIEPDETTIVDLAVDGADEIDGRLDCIKGGGAALLREKIIAVSAKRFVVIADDSKKRAELGRFPLPVEIEPFAFALTVRALREALAAHGHAGAQISLRAAPEGGHRRSDGGHFIVDCALSRIKDAGALDRALKEIPGVIETGLFVGVAHDAFIAGPGGIDHLTRR